MGTRHRSDVLRAIRSFACSSRHEKASDRDLLIRFVEKRDEGAFSALVRRHSFMVMGVGLRVLRHYQDAEDVCQATFLLLAKKANATPWGDSVASWLYQIAYQLALKARRTANRRKAHEGTRRSRSRFLRVRRLSARCPGQNGHVVRNGEPSLAAISPAHCHTTSAGLLTLFLSRCQMQWSR
jgi:hypothetical protein